MFTSSWGVRVKIFGSIAKAVAGAETFNDSVLKNSKLRLSDGVTCGLRLSKFNLHNIITSTNCYDIAVIEFFYSLYSVYR